MNFNFFPHKRNIYNVWKGLLSGIAKVKKSENGNLTWSRVHTSFKHIENRARKYIYLEIEVFFLRGENMVKFLLQHMMISRGIFKVLIRFSQAFHSKKEKY